MPKEVKVEAVATMAFVFYIIILVLGAITAFFAGEGEGFWTYAFLFLISRINGVGGILWLVLVVAGIFLGSEKMKTGAWVSVAFVAVTTLGLLLMLSPYYHLTLSLF